FEVKINEQLNEKRELDIDVTLYYCLPKGEKLELVIQKATELGVNRIIGVNSSRCIAKIDESKKNNKIERFNKIMKEASEQSHRTYIPTFDDVINFKDLKNTNEDIKLIAYELEAQQENNLLTIIKNIVPGSKVAILIGAEGGFSQAEVDEAVSYGYQRVSLGKRILRSETAAIYLMSVISFVRESN
ncbi:MAG: RNA methyltransferase, partial [Bacilli bacterium]|nr:RNA methyltransferase [Bacilli bacterium]